MASAQKRDPQTEIYRKLTPLQRIAAACQLYSFAKEIIRMRIRRTHPAMSEAELEKKVRLYF